ncbi:MAG: efflux RND transporter permease subunit, partial [bacterium]
MVELTPGGDLEAREAALMDDARARVPAAVAAARSPAEPEVRLRRPGLFSLGTPVELVLYDDDLKRLREASALAVERVAEVPGLTDVRSSMVAGFPEVQLRYDRELLRRYGLDTGTIADRMRGKVLGTAATQVTRGDGRVDLRVRLVEDDRRSVAELRRLNINPQLVPAIPLEAVADLREAEGPSEIRRLDQRRAVAVTANVAGFDVAGAAERVADA